MSDFIRAIKNHKNGNFIIAEIKLASPSAGFLGKKEEIIRRVRQYEQAGAGAISVVTEKKLFKGDPVFVKKIKENVSLPVLQKEFVTDFKQLERAKEMGADAILLIAGIVSPENLQILVKEAAKLGLEPVVEVNNEAELRVAVRTKTKIIAVNARNLETFNIDVDKARRLLRKIPDKFIKLGFSGINSYREVEKYKKAGADGVLAGTALMKTKNIKKLLNDLIDASVKVKICGIRSLEAARVAVKAGADFLGFNFVTESKRFIDPSSALKIINKIKSRVKTVGIFQDAPVDYVNKIVNELNLDFVQLHGSEKNEYVLKMKKPVIKSIIQSDNPETINADFFILDREKRGKGKMMNLKKATKISNNFSIFFAGGLTSQNVAKVVKIVRPFAVDVAGGVETDGVLDSDKIRKFIQNAKGVLF